MSLPGDLFYRFKTCLKLTSPPTSCAATRGI